jgi:hypothetical protein
MSRRRYSKTEYFEFLYDMAFTSDKYYELAKVLHSMDYIWYNLMDENTMYNGIEIRKYYLCDELGYMPEEIDEYDEYIFPANPSVLEVLVGFSNKLCRDVLNWKVPKLIKIFLGNWGIDYRSDKEEIEHAVLSWENGELGIFGDDVDTDLDLWSQSAAWMANFE